MNLQHLMVGISITMILVISALLAKVNAYFAYAFMTYIIGNLFINSINNFMSIKNNEELARKLQEMAGKDEEK